MREELCKGALPGALRTLDERDKGLAAPEGLLGPLERRRGQTRAKRSVPIVLVPQFCERRFGGGELRSKQSVTHPAQRATKKHTSLHVDPPIMVRSVASPLPFRSEKPRP